jgi:hypothetical protein
MKQLIGRVASEVLYYLGDWIHYPMIWFDWAWIYPTYSYLMDRSYRIQTWGGAAGPWTTVKEQQ